MPTYIDMTKPILRATSPQDFVGAVAGLPRRPFIPINDAPVSVYDVHAVGDLVQQRFVDARIDGSQAVSCL